MTLYKYSIIARLKNEQPPHYLFHMKKTIFRADLYSHILHTNVVSLIRFARLVTRLVFLQPMGHRLGCLDHVLQLVWVWCRVALQDSFLQKESKMLKCSILIPILILYGKWGEIWHKPLGAFLARLCLRHTQRPPELCACAVLPRRLD